MLTKLANWIAKPIIAWLVHERPHAEAPICDFDRLCYEIRSCDILLMEGRSPVSGIIQRVTQSSWSHAALYIGRLYDLDNPDLRALIQQHYKGNEDDQLLIESILGQGTVVSNINLYKDNHIRICRAVGLARQDAQRVITYAAGRLGMEYNVRHIFDLLRLLLPWSIIPKRIGSTIFNTNPGEATKQICSTLLAEAFSSVRFPILPHIKKTEDGNKVEYILRNPRLYTPSDFDYSPYFDIIKYPVYEMNGKPAYHHLPWSEREVYSNDKGELVEEELPRSEEIAKIPTSTDDTTKVNQPEASEASTENKRQTEINFQDDQTKSD